MNPEDIKTIFGMQPEAAVAYLRQKGITCWMMRTPPPSL